MLKKALKTDTVNEMAAQMEPKHLSPKHSRVPSLTKIDAHKFVDPTIPLCEALSTRFNLRSYA